MLLNIKCLIILTSFFPGVILQTNSYSYEGYIVNQCQLETIKFAAYEDQYADKLNRFASPSLDGPQKQDLQLMDYEKDQRQRPFECISNKLNESSDSRLLAIPEYLNLVLQCQFGQLTLCDPSYPYRKIDGTCNNLLNPKWGSVQCCARRMLPAYYEGVSGFRKSVCGTPLPEPRTLSLKLFTEKDRPSPIYNNLFVFFSQLITHDIADTPITNVRGQRLDCCSDLNHQHPQCAPVLLSPDDPFFSTLNITCFNFIRSAPCDSCSVGKRTQMVQPTSYIDCSFVYGLTEDEARNLRSNDESGKLITQYREAGELMPPDYDMPLGCGSIKNHEYCFRAGDRRVNQHAPLISFQTVFLREHNRVAEELKQQNPYWDEETLYQESRKIVIGEMQVIVYNEFLPLLLGPDLMSAYQLRTSEEGRSVYNPLVDSSLLLEFNTAAFRLHTTVRGTVTDLGTDGWRKTLTDFISDAATIYHGQMGLLLEGLSLTAGQKFGGGYATKEITERVYKGPLRAGFDLVSLDIQRGRDHGLPPYVEVLRGLSGGKIDIQDFDGLNQVFDPADVELMKTIYCDVRDIDFIVGMNYERIKENMIVSSTSAEIIAMELRNLKFGDRFYFEHGGNFNDDQLRTLKEVTLAKLFCDNSDITSIQQYALMFPSLSNPIKQCSDIPGLNLDYWRS